MQQKFTVLNFLIVNILYIFIIFYFFSCYVTTHPGKPTIICIKDRLWERWRRDFVFFSSERAFGQLWRHMTARHEWISRPLSSSTTLTFRYSLTDWIQQFAESIPHPYRKKCQWHSCARSEWWNKQTNKKEINDRQRWSDMWKWVKRHLFL